MNNIAKINPDDIDLERLPHAVRSIAQCVGTTWLLVLVKRFGGQRVNVPMRRLMHLSQLYDVLPDYELGRLCDQLAGTTIELPVADSLCRLARDRLIAYDIARNGLTNNEAAKKYQLSRRHVIRIKRNYSVTATPRPDLFE